MLLKAVSYCYELSTLKHEFLIKPILEESISLAETLYTSPHGLAEDGLLMLFNIKDQLSLEPSGHPVTPAEGHRNLLTRLIHNFG